MSKENNLTDFLVDVADAIRAKNGTTELINPQNFSEEIKNLPSGGEEDYSDDVIFIDYDGKVLYRYTAEEFMALSELPEYPSHELLTSLGWNWTLEEAKAYVGECGMLTIGATYESFDGKTRLFITVDNPKHMSVTMRIKPVDITSVCTIDWGDGSTQELVDNVLTEVSHSYDNIGEYIIAIDSEGGVTTLGGGTDTTTLFTEKSYNREMLRKVYMGDKTRVYASYNAFQLCSKLKYIVLNKFDGNGILISTDIRAAICRRGENETGYSMFQYSSIKVASFPGNWEGTYLYSTFDNSDIERFEFPVGGKYTPKGVLNNCHKLKRVVFPNNVTAFNGGGMAGYSLIERLILPDIPSIGTMAFRNCNALLYVKLRSSIKEIKGYAFYCANIRTVIIEAIVPPTIDTTTFTTSKGFNGYFYVPNDSVEAYKSATNWASYADKIKPISEYVEPTTE